MNDNTKATLTNIDTWKRGLFMVVFCIISGVAKLLVALVAVFQFVTLLFKGQVNETILPLGQNLSTYLYQITLFLTFKSNEMPYPFHDFPNGAPKPFLKEDSKEDNKEDIATDESTTNHEQTVDSTDENIDSVDEGEDETKAQNNTKDAPLKD